MSSGSKDKDNKSNDSFKILTIGESGVGKTSILRRYVQNKFEKHHLATIGIDYQTKTLKIKDKEIKLKIWDTAGQERYRNIANQVYKGADGVILVFDVTDEFSFTKISDWMEQINNNEKKNEIAIILIGNKCDLTEERMVSEEKGREKAESLSIQYYETSAASGKGINEAFLGLAEIILNNNKLKNNSSRTISLASKKAENIIENNENKKKKKKCC